MTNCFKLILFLLQLHCSCVALGIPQAEGKNLKRYYNAGHGEEWETYVKQTPPVVLLPNCLYLVLPGIVKGLCCCELDRYKYRANKESLTESPVTA